MTFCFPKEDITFAAFLCVLSVLMHSENLISSESSSVPSIVPPLSLCYLQGSLRDGFRLEAKTLLILIKDLNLVSTDREIPKTTSLG